MEYLDICCENSVQLYTQVHGHGELAGGRGRGPQPADRVRRGAAVRGGAQGAGAGGGRAARQGQHRPQHQGQARPHAALHRRGGGARVRGEVSAGALHHRRQLQVVDIIFVICGFEMSACRLLFTSMSLFVSCVI